MVTEPKIDGARVRRNLFEPVPNLIAPLQHRVWVLYDTPPVPIADREFKRQVVDCGMQQRFTLLESALRLLSLGDVSRDLEYSADPVIIVKSPAAYFKRDAPPVL